jgi:ribosome-binding factor A
MEGQSVRQNKISKLILTTLADLFQKKGFSAFGGAMITVTEVRISSDLSFAKVYLSVFATSKTKEEVLELVKLENKSLRYELGKKIKHSVRIIPELSFYLDITLDELDKIDKLLK